MTTYTFTLPNGQTATRRSKVKAFPYAVVMAYTDPNNGGTTAYHVSFASTLDLAEREAATIRRVCANYRDLIVTVEPTKTA